ncbi:hypothetical protein [Paenibacillus rigui]|uniref:Uncharacterized protein n=1 Tax=Paenibacillus rigui TaxID=554312 RepID=A0A229UUZ7_9BACL|nr:hypothetical protein [Paenibacillus rigui]OXM87238.1 hypothetical protein CF651_06220 [Paenibacillus rigui]
MPNTAVTLTRLRRFINQAESAWFTVYDSHLDKEITVNGGIYFKLPLRFSTVSKVINYFRRFWSLRFSRIMLCNMRPIIYKGRLLVVAGDPPIVPFRVVTLRIVRETSQHIYVRAVLTDGIETRQTVDYTILKKSNNRLTIIRRTKTAGDFRYQPCTLMLKKKCK